MALILNIETATKNCSVSLSNNGEVIAIQELNDGNYSHAEKLHVFIEEVLTRVSKTVNDLNAIAVSKGPGSYTGLRIGVSSAKGLCFALDIPLIAIDTLQSLALQIKEEGVTIVPMLDARRMEVYSAVFDSKNKSLRAVEAEVITEDSFRDFIEASKTYFIGDGVEKTMQCISHENAVFVKGKLPSSNEMSQLSYEKFKAKDFENVAYFEPFYLKDFLVTPRKK